MGNNLASLSRRHQFDPKTTSFAGLRFNAGAPTHAFDAFAHDRQPDARALILLWPMQPFEHLKNPIARIRLDTDAIIAKVQSHTLTPRLSPNFDHGRRSRQNKLHAILEQVADALRQQRAIGDDERQRRFDRDGRTMHSQIRVQYR